MKLTVDQLKSSLKEIGFTDEQLTGMSKAQLEGLANGYMRQDDYDRAMNEGKAEIKKLQEAHAQATERLNAEMAEWATLQASGREQTEKQRADLEAAQLRVTQLTQRITRLAQDSGIDPAKALEGIEQVVKPAEPPKVDLTGYVKQDDVNRQIGHLANMAMTLPAELFALATEHQSLFGEPLDTRAIVTELQSRAGTRNNQKSLEPRAIWEELHKVPEKRAAVDKAKYDADIKAAEERGRTAALSEQVLPGAQVVPGKHSVVFGGARESAIKRPQPGTTVNTAAAAFRTGKYKQGGSGQKPAA